MPKPTKGPRLGGGPAHERLLLANLAAALFTHKSITTTADTYMHLDREDLEEGMKLASIRWQELTAEEEAD